MILALLLASPALAEGTEEPSFSVGFAGAWAIPTETQPIGYHHLRQDIAASVIGQWQYRRALIQAEILHSGFSAKNPELTSFGLRVGAVLYKGVADLYATAGVSYMTYGAKSDTECSNFGCNPLAGNGPALLGEVGLLLPFPEGFLMRPAAIAQLFFPLFTVEQDIYGHTSADAAPVVLLGFRLLFGPR